MAEDEVIQRIRQTIRDGTFGQDYTIADRDKYRGLKRDYIIDDNKIIEILLSLEIDDLQKVEGSTNPHHLEDIVYVFKKTVPLIPRWVEDAHDTDVRIYIKITWPFDKTGMFIISFHEDNV